MSVRSPAGVSDEELFEVDAGEREAILLAEELNVDAIMIDDRDGRVIAERRGLRVLGTLGFLEIAHREGKLNFIDALLDLKAAGFYVHRDLEISFLHRLGFN
jgi:predicted nucleic acid-binding protein